MREMARLKAQPGKPILAHGGARFAQSLVAEVDESRPRVHPVALGDGLPLVPRMPSPEQLALVEARPFRSGVVLHVCGPA
jgi:dihydrofolate reductase